jgi:hypothetical protein
MTPARRSYINIHLTHHTPSCEYENIFKSRPPEIKLPTPTSSLVLLITMSNTKTPNPSNPSSLPPRYSIRKLDNTHAAWSAAIISHANTFHSPVWPILYPEDKSKLFLDVYAACDYLVQHQLDSGMSYGVFDDEYVYKTPEAQDLGGKLDWGEGTEDDTGAAFLQGMDFPLVSVAMSFDAHDAWDLQKLAPLLTALPHFGRIGGVLNSLDTRDPETWQATGPGQVLQRNATATRYDYLGQGLMSGLARWVMREAESKGFRGIQIVALDDAVAHVWGKPPAPYKGAVVSSFDMESWEDEKGEVAFKPSKQVARKCYVELKPKE